MLENNNVIPRTRLANVTEAASENVDWGLSVGTALARRGMWESEIWPALCRAWLKGVTTDEQRSAVLELLVAHPRLDRLADRVADLLVHWWWTDKTVDPSEALLAQGEQIADRIWAVYSSEPLLPQEPANGWLHEAINHPAGKVVQFWLYTLSLLRKRIGDKWPGRMPGVYCERFSSVVTGMSGAAQLGRVVIASQVRFIFAVDPAWAKENALPLLDFAINIDRAQSAWDGFLSWGTWDEGILPELLPLYERSFVYLLAPDQPKYKRLCEHLANIAVFASVNPLDNGWLDKFIIETQDETRATWAVYVRQCLGSLSNEKVAGLWDRWLARYWDRRNQGCPEPLGKAEIRAMVEWLPHLDAVFSSAAKKALSVPAPKYEYTNIYSELLKRRISERYPTELAQLLLHLLPTISPGFNPFCRDLEGLVKGIPVSAIPPDVYKKLCDELARIGCPDAAAIFASYQSISKAEGLPQGNKGPPRVFDLIAQLRGGSRSKADIDNQIQRERESWERDR
jgi:hypothetical protein